jgi:hypothetical protein
VNEVDAMIGLGTYPLDVPMKLVSIEYLTNDRRLYPKVSLEDSGVQGLRRVKERLEDSPLRTGQITVIDVGPKETKDSRHLSMGGA